VDGTIPLLDYYRMLYYFFVGTAAAVVSHGLTKEQAVPAREIDVAIRRKHAFTTIRHAYVRGAPTMTKNVSRPPTRSEILHRRYFKGKPKMLALLEEERATPRLPATSTNSAPRLASPTRTRQTCRHHRLGNLPS